MGIIFANAQQQLAYPGLQNLAEIQKRSVQLRKEEADRKKRRKKLKKYNVELVQKLIDKYLPKKPEQFQKEMRKRVEEFEKDATAFFEDELRTAKDVHDIVVLDEQQEKVELDSAYGLLNEVLRNNCLLVFPPQSVEDFKREYRDFYNDLCRMLDQDWTDEKRLRSGKHPTIGFFKEHFSSDKGLAGQISKIDRQLLKKYPQLKGIEARLRDEAQNGTKPDFLKLFVEYLKSVGRLEKIVAIIRTDLKELIVRDIQEFNDVLYTINPFIQLVRNYPEFSNGSLKAKADEFYNQNQHLHDKAEDYVNIDSGAQKLAYNEIEQEDALMKQLFAKLDEGLVALYKENARRRAA